MNKLDITKKVAGFVVGSGVAKIVNDIIANNITIEHAYQKVTVIAGAAVIGMMAKDATKAYTDTTIDECVQEWKNIKVGS